MSLNVEDWVDQINYDKILLHLSEMIWEVDDGSWESYKVELIEGYDNSEFWDEASKLEEWKVGLNIVTDFNIIQYASSVIKKIKTIKIDSLYKLRKVVLKYREEIINNYYKKIWLESELAVSWEQLYVQWNEFINVVMKSLNQKFSTDISSFLVLNYKKEIEERILKSLDDFVINRIPENIRKSEWFKWIFEKIVKIKNLKTRRKALLILSSWIEELFSINIIFDDERKINFVYLLIQWLSKSRLDKLFKNINSFNLSLLIEYFSNKRWLEVENWKDYDDYVLDWFKEIEWDEKCIEFIKLIWIVNKKDFDNFIIDLNKLGIWNFEGLNIKIYCDLIWGLSKWWEEDNTDTQENYWEQRLIDALKFIRLEICEINFENYILLWESTNNLVEIIENYRVNWINLWKLVNLINNANTENFAYMIEYLEEKDFIYLVNNLSWDKIISFLNEEKTTKYICELIYTWNNNNNIKSFLNVYIPLEKVIDNINILDLSYLVNSCTKVHFLINFIKKVEIDIILELLEWIWKKKVLGLIENIKNDKLISLLWSELKNSSFISLINALYKLNWLNNFYKFVNQFDVNIILYFILKIPTNIFCNIILSENYTLFHWRLLEIINNDWKNINKNLDKLIDILVKRWKLWTGKYILNIEFYRINHRVDFGKIFSFFRKNKGGSLKIGSDQSEPFWENIDPIRLKSFSDIILENGFYWKFSEENAKFLKEGCWEEELFLFILNVDHEKVFEYIERLGINKFIILFKWIKDEKKLYLLFNKIEKIDNLIFLHDKVDWNIIELINKVKYLDKIVEMINELDKSDLSVLLNELDISEIINELWNLIYFKKLFDFNDVNKLIIFLWKIYIEKSIQILSNGDNYREFIQGFFLTRTISQLDRLIFLINEKWQILRKWLFKRNYRLSKIVKFD